jgi:PAS domain-containing protein
MHPTTAGLAMAGARAKIPAGTKDATAVLTLDDAGTICDCNGEGEALFQYRRDELIGQHVSLLLPQLAELELMQGGHVNPHLRVRCRFGCHFQAVTRDDERFAIDLFLNMLGSGGHNRLSVIVRRLAEVGRENGLASPSD